VTIETVTKERMPPDLKKKIFYAANLLDGIKPNTNATKEKSHRATI